MNNLIKASFFFLLTFLISCGGNNKAPLPEEHIEFISYIYGKTSQGDWQSCQSFTQHFPSLEKVGPSETIDCLDTMICQDVESRSLLLEYIRARKNDNIHVEFISFVSQETGEGIVRSCQKYLMNFPDIKKVGFSDIIECLDLMLCQSEDEYSRFLEYFHRYLQAL